MAKEPWWDASTLAVLRVLTNGEPTSNEIIEALLAEGWRPPEPVNPSDREALGKIIWETSRADEASISATGANIVADAILASGWSRPVPADDRVLDAFYSAASTAMRVNRFQWNDSVINAGVRAVVAEIEARK